MKPNLIDSQIGKISEQVAAPDPWVRRSFKSASYDNTELVN